MLFFHIWKFSRGMVLTMTMEKPENIITFPLGRRGLAGPANTPSGTTAMRLLVIAKMLDDAADETPFPLWVKGLANEARRVARQVMK